MQGTGEAPAASLPLMGEKTTTREGGNFPTT